MSDPKGHNAADPASLPAPVSTSTPGPAPAPGHRPAHAPDADRSVRLGAIDVGTNSIRLIVVEAFSDGSYKLLDDEKAITRLGRGFSSTGALQPEPMEESINAIKRMKTIAQGYNVERLRVAGTCAVREATNGGVFIDTLRDRAGVTLEIISAEEEARLAFQSVSAAFDLSQVAAAVVDVGGGSTEIVISSRGAVEEVYTLPLGAVRLTERFGGCDADDEDAFRAMRKSVRKTLDQGVGGPALTPEVMFGTGGTFTALAGIAMQRGSSRGEGDMLPFSVRGFELRRADVRHIQDWLRDMPLRARSRVAGLSPDRAEIIIAGLTIVERVMKRLGVNVLRVHDRGIRDGIIMSMIREVFPGAGRSSTDPRDRLRHVRQFAVQCRYEEPHCRHVTGLALSIFDQMAALESARSPELPHWATRENRELLEAAGLLHDIGYLVNYSKHHKHSYHLIVHSEMDGFTSREVEIIANIARYHRRADPSAKRHAAFAALSGADRELVRRLAGILRIADGLDRTHTQGVTALNLARSRGVLRIRVEAQEDPGVNLWGASHKCALFERAFGVPVRLDWSGPVAGAGATVEPKLVTRRARHPGPSSGAPARKSARHGPESV